MTDSPMKADRSILIEGLKEEKESRKSEDGDIKRELGGLSKKVLPGTIAIWILALLVTAAVTAAVTVLVTTAMQKPQSAPPVARAPIDMTQ